MAILEMNMDGCDIAHESLLLREYIEEVMFAGLQPQLSPAGTGTVAPLNKHTKDRGGPSRKVTSSPAPVKSHRRARFLRIATIPKCP